MKMMITATRSRERSIKNEFNEKIGENSRCGEKRGIRQQPEEKVGEPARNRTRGESNYG